MSKIDVTKWKNFIIEELFDKCELKYKKENHLTYQWFKLKNLICH